MGRVLNRFRVRRAEKKIEKGKDQRAAVLLAKAGVLDVQATIGANQSAEINDLYIGSPTSDVDPNTLPDIIDPFSYFADSALTEEELADFNEQARSAAIYDLHEFDPVKLATGQIDPMKINNIKFRPYTQTNTGIIQIDKNKDLSNYRNFFSLATSKPSQIKFDQVIDIEFKEFITLPKEDILEIENEQLRNQIGLLQQRTIINLVPDTLSINSRLYSDRKGNLGDPAYPKIEDRLLSKNRTAIAVMQDDGNFVIYRGTFNARGQQIAGTNIAPVWAKGYDEGLGAPNYFTVRYNKDSKETTVAVGGLRNGIVRYVSEKLQTSETVRVVLDDNGILNVYDQGNIVWSTFGKN